MVKSLDNQLVAITDEVQTTTNDLQSSEREAKIKRAVLQRRPVQARGDDVWYRMRRHLRRYWVPMAASMTGARSLSVSNGKSGMSAGLTACVSNTNT